MKLDNDKIISLVRHYTLVSTERLLNVLDSVEKVILNDIPGDFIEIGVWKGGLIMAMALKCKQMNASRKIHAYDTFEGMTAPTVEDRDLTGTLAEKIIDSIKCYSSYDETVANIERARYENIEYHRGDILQTSVEDIPKEIALLRLDTDWYESTKFELLHFEKNVSKGGFIIVDDYGHWEGCKKAVDEFIENKSIVLNKIDYSAVYWNKE